MEAPQRIRASRVDGVINWIGHYRPDSDILFSYGSIKKIGKSKKTNFETRGQSSKKKKLAAWLVSHCYTGGRRELLVQSLQKYIPVDSYGKCGDFKCPSHGDCREYLAKNYKFYLAFENSICLDYVTEKMYYNLRQDIVPVTYAWINDTHALPPNSYINAFDFRSVKALADYLVHLDQDEDEYAKYFEWKRQYRVVQTYGLCEACGRLLKHRENTNGPHRSRQKVRRYKSMLAWLNDIPGGSDGGRNEATAQLRVGNQLVITNQTCVRPADNKILMNWISDLNNS